MDRTVKVLVILFAVIGIGMFGYHWFNQWHSEAVQRAVNQEKEACLEKIAKLEAEINSLAEELERQPQLSPGKQDLTDVFGEAKPVSPLKPDLQTCQKTAAQVTAFFQYLDSKAYLIWPGTNMQAEALFDEIAAKLAAHPPINVGEMEDLYSLIRNVTHFYRILGKNRIDLIKEILKSESAVLEPSMSVIFVWLAQCDKTARGGKEQPSLKTLYQYACFFLNTLGGRSYLLRREGKVRMLVNYYSLLIVDLANDAKLNSYGIDIRPHLDYVFYDLNNQKGLMYRERYLTRLAALQDKYQ